MVSQKLKFLVVAGLISVVQLNQVIWDGGITKAQKKAIEANGEIAKADLDVTVYPNPASSIVNFSIQNSKTSISGGNKITLFNTDGRIVHESVLTELDFSINISHLPSGIYYAKLNLGELIINKKIVICR